MRKASIRTFFVSVGITLMMLVSVMPAMAQENNYISNRIGIGYQGMLAGEFLNGISARGWIGDNFGLELSGFYGSVDIDIDLEDEDVDLEDEDVDLTLGELKAMYAFIVKENSRFYVGAKGGYGQLDIGEDVDLWECGVFIGSEWNFQGIPELGFNFDVGYNYLHIDEDDYDVELDIDGIGVTFGIHYYF